VDLLTTLGPAILAIGSVRLWAFWVSRDQAQHADRAGHLFYGSAVKFGAIACAILAACAIQAAQQAPAGQWLPSAMMTAVLTLGAIWFLLESHMVEMRYDDRVIEATTRLGRRRVVPWNAVTGWRYVRWADVLVIETRQEGSLHVRGHLAGLPNFIDTLALRLYGRTAASPG
jgi:hypothetical protein